ncbi:DUF2306 domain-containing protein [Devosia sp.]|uniref:DUF2306 domain-containing protein n=1 Tax=Devosia sp. TaxID=1871048 RepID=UPI002FCBCEB7
MSLSPLLAASPAIQMHAYSAMLAFMLGAYVLFLPKGDSTHKRLGRVWATLMVIVATTSFFIWESRVFGPFSPIHLLSVSALVLLGLAIRAARMRNIKAHLRIMQSTYLGALVIAGWFTFMPGRIMNEVVFGPNGGSPLQSGVFLASSILGGTAILLLLRHANRRRGPRINPAE